MLSMKNAAKLLLLSMMGMMLAACSSMPPAVSPPVVAPTVIPPLSVELKREPLPSGSYWARVTKWRATWDETLKTLQPKSEVSSSPTSH